MIGGSPAYKSYNPNITHGARPLSFEVFRIGFVDDPVPRPGIESVDRSHPPVRS